MKPTLSLVPPPAPKMEPKQAPTSGIRPVTKAYEPTAHESATVGDGSIVPSLLHAYVESTLLAPNRAELLFRSVDYAPAASDLIPDTAQICNCNAVSKAQIIESVLAGARSLSAVCAATRAGTGCGI